MKRSTHKISLYFESEIEGSMKEYEIEVTAMFYPEEPKTLEYPGCSAEWKNFLYSSKNSSEDLLEKLIEEYESNRGSIEEDAICKLNDLDFEN